MPADKQEVLDDFIMDMDIETITLDDMQVKESDKNQDGRSQEMSFSEQANNQFFGDLKMNNVNIEEIKLGEPTGGASQKPLLGGDGQNVTINIEHASIAGDIKGDIKGDWKGDVKGDFKGDIKKTESENKPETDTETGKGGLRRKIGREIATEAAPIMEELAPASLSDVPEVDIPDFGRMNASGEITMDTLDDGFLKNVESDITLGELNKIEETPEPSIPQEIPMEDTVPVIDREPPARRTNVPRPADKARNDSIFNSEDDIIFIDGSELDKLVFGQNGDARKETPSINNVPVMEEIPVESPEDIPVPSDEREITIPVDQIRMNVKETVPLAEEIITEEEPVSSLDIPPLDEGIIRENDTAVEQIEINLEEPQPAVKAEAEPEFNFDLSVIPDVEMVEEDEPIALSLDELNNIDISDNTVMGFNADSIPAMETLPAETPGTAAAPAEDDEKIEISLDELNEIQKDISPDQGKDEKTRFIDEQIENLSGQSKDELRTVLSYLDKLLEDLPEDRIKEFAKSDYYDLYVKILDKLGV